MCNAPATFMRLMDVLLTWLQWNICMIYLDDILVFAKDFCQMIERLGQVFDRLQKGGLELRLSKCKFCFPEVEYLTHRISDKGIQPDTSKL